MLLYVLLQILPTICNQVLRDGREVVRRVTAVGRAQASTGGAGGAEASLPDCRPSAQPRSPERVGLV